MDLAVATVIVVRVFLVVTMLGLGLRLGAGGVPAVVPSRGWWPALLFVNLVLVPAAGTGICLVLGLRGEVAVALLACAIAPAGSLAPKLVDLAGGDLARGIAGTFVLAALATLTVPATIGLATASLGLAIDAASLDVVAVMTSLAIFQLLPMVVGLALARRSVGGRLVGPLTIASNGLMVAIAVVAVVDTVDDLIGVGPLPFVAMILVALVGHVAGWVIATDRAGRRASALVTAQRSPGLALLIVAGPGHPTATATVVVATLALTMINLAAALVYGRRPGPRTVEVAAGTS